MTLRPRLSGNLRISIHNHFTQIAQKFGRAIFQRRELKEFRRLRQKRSGDAALLKMFMVHDIHKERDIRLHATDASPT